jgi:GrpB-like predicted nucleotidyltransferase (UPF0157 family)
MVGLRRGVVEVVPHSGRWGTLFIEEQRRLRRGLDGLAVDIQHIGSSAVPDLVAKPILDIAVAVADHVAFDRCRIVLPSLGYLDRGDQGASGGWLFVKESSPDVRTVHLHLVTVNDPQWRNYLRFRDALRADADLRTAYGRLKLELRDRFAGDRLGYTEAKHEFIRSALQRHDLRQ